MGETGERSGGNWGGNWECGTPLSTPSYNGVYGFSIATKKLKFIYMYIPSLVPVLATRSGVALIVSGW